MSRLLAYGMVWVAGTSPLLAQGDGGGESMSIDERINAFMSPITDWVFKFVFVSIDVPTGTGDSIDLPLIVLWLVGAALIFTLHFRFINLRAIGMAFRTIRGKYSKPEDPGEITHFQALSAALSATVGLGNIAGVALAITMGGPGAVFWMILAGFLGMTTKFAECTLGVKYRKIIGGKVFGGPMYYLQEGFKERDMAGLGKVLGVFFAVMCVGAALGGGNMYQANQSGQQLLGVVESDEHIRAQDAHDEAKKELAKLQQIGSETDEVKERVEKLSAEVEKTKRFDWQLGDTSELLRQAEARLEMESQNLSGQSPQILAVAKKVTETHEKMEDTKGFFSKQRWVFGLVLAIAVGLVIIGGITSIASVTARLVPAMTVIYITGCLVVLIANIQAVPDAFESIISKAFEPMSAAGGFMGAFIMGIRRAAFSNEAGFGSAPIAHAAVKTRYPASEGLVALLEPMMDTIVVCTMTGLAIVVTAESHGYVAGEGGVQLTSAAFETVIPWFQYILLVCVILFAFSTMISWSYYGQQAWSFLFGRGKGVEIVYKVLFCTFIIIGASLSLGQVMRFSDGMLFAMSLFNLIGVYALLPVVKRELTNYNEHMQRIDRDE